MPILVPFLIGAATGSVAMWAYLNSQPDNSALEETSEKEPDVQDIPVITQEDNQVAQEKETSAQYRDTSTLWNG